MNEIRELMDRPKLYYNVDGMGELATGSMLLGYALLEWMQLHSAQNSAWNQMYGFWTYVAVMLSVIHFGSKGIKNRITFRRTGFVDFRARDKYWIPMAVGAGVSVLFVAGLFVARRQHWDASALVSLAGLAIAASYIRIARTVSWKWWTFWAMVAGSLAVALLPANVPESLASNASVLTGMPPRLVGSLWLTMVLYGTLLMISGAVSFWLYIRRTHAPAQEEQ